MATTHFRTLNHSPQIVAEWLNELSLRLGWSNKQHCYILLRSILHALRDWLTVDEAANLSAQLPVLVRGIYFENWNPSSTPVHPRSKSDFIDRVQREFSKDPLGDPERAIRIALKFLTEHLSTGEVSHVKAAMRKDLRELWPSEEAD